MNLTQPQANLFQACQSKIERRKISTEKSFIIKTLLFSKHYNEVARIWGFYHQNNSAFHEHHDAFTWNPINGIKTPKF